MIFFVFEEMPILQKRKCLGIEALIFWRQDVLENKTRQT